jgi:hypothetical protein
MVHRRRMIFSEHQNKAEMRNNVTSVNYASDTTSFAYLVPACCSNVCYFASNPSIKWATYNRINHFSLIIHLYFTNCDTLLTTNRHIIIIDETLFIYAIDTTRWNFEWIRSYCITGQTYQTKFT